MPDSEPGATPPDAGGTTRTHGVVCGLDLSGFSAWAEAHLQREGQAGIEAIADTLDTFFLRCEAALAVEGFQLREFLGDGLLALGAERPGEPPDRRDRRLSEALSRADPPGPLRVASAAGEIWGGQAGGWNGRWLDVLSGPAVSRCHARLRDRATATPANLARTWAPPRATYAPSKLSEAELAEQAFLVARVTHADPEAAWAAFLWALPRAQSTADAGDGVLEAATHDDAGLMLRLAFPRGAIGEAAAHDCGRWLLSTLRHQGADAGVGLAAGRVFRGVARWASGPVSVVQGAAINRAAKLAKSALGISCDASFGVLTEPAVRWSATTPRGVSIGDLPGFGDYSDLRQATAETAPPAEIHIEAPPGLGKSFLLKTLAAEPRRSPPAMVAAEPRHSADALWLATRVAHALAAARPEVDAVLQAAPRAERAALTRRLNPAQRGGAEADITLASELVLRAFAALDSEQPQLLLIDDLQWADEASLALIRGAMDRRAPMHLVTTRRGDGAGVDHPLGRPVRLAPLGLEGLRRALDAVGAGLDPAAAAEVHRLSGGAPLFGLQLALHAREAGILPDAGLAGVLERRLARVAPEERAVLRVLALADRPAPADRVQRALEQGPDEVARALATLRERQLLEHGDDGFTISHRAISEHVVTRMPGSVRAGLHRRLARALATGAGALGGGEIGDHYVAGGEPRRGGVRHLRDAEAALQAGAYAAASALFERALAALELPGEDTEAAALWRAHAVAGQALCAWGMGRVTAAHEQARKALADLDTALGGGRARRGARRRFQAVARGRPAGLPRRARAAVLRASVARTETSLFRGDLRGMISANLVCARLPVEGRGQAGARARGLSTVALLFGLARLDGLAALTYRQGLSLTPGPEQAYVIASRAVWDLAFGRWEAAKTALRLAAETLGEAPNPHLREVLITLEALCAQLEGRLDHCEKAFGRLEAAARLRGNDLHVAWGLYGRAMPLLHGGRVAEALALAEAAGDLLRDAGDLQSDLNAIGLAAQAHARCGNTLEALELATRGVHVARTGPPLNFGTLEGYAGPAAVAAALAVDERLPSDVRRQAADLLPAAIASLSRFARVFPIGRPRLLALRSLAADGPDAARLAKRASREAERRGMAAERWGQAWFDPRQGGSS